jgi:hypothetical protein
MVGRGSVYTLEGTVNIMRSSLIAGKFGMVGVPVVAGSVAQDVASVVVTM